jgi:hypothetical protein
MENDNILVEREFEISLGGQSHKVKAVAVFVRLGYEVGYYHLNFTLRGQLTEIIQPDETRYSREQAKRAAEFAFSSGQVEALAKSQIQQWIHLGY